MGWGAKQSPTDAQDAQSVIASIFDPAHRSLSAATAVANTARAPLQTSPSSSSSSSPIAAAVVLRGEESETASSGLWRALTHRLSALHGGTQLPDGAHAEAETHTEPTSALNSNAPSPSLTWDQLPPCPLAGYQLTHDGLTDTLRRPPHTLSAAELKSLIGELTSLEQQAKYTVDKEFSGHLGSRSLHGLELLVNPCLFLTSIYLMAWKAPQLYRTALPQDSLLFTRLLALVRRRMPAGQREQLAQRHRRLMQLTNARVALSFFTGAGLFALAWVSRPPPNVLEEAPDVQAAKQMIAYQRHSEASLKWCWYVYYHHPAYRAASPPMWESARTRRAAASEARQRV